ncbi:MAG: hypothetical protein LM632_06380 [Armatimonadetes bacterium]|nr:hypothetical protein [Armatimonadota bacterium]
MRKEIPAWVAAVVIIVVIVIVAVAYYLASTVRPRGITGPTPPEVKAKMQQYLPKMKGAGPGAPMHGAYHGGYGVHGAPPTTAPQHGR